MLIFVTTFHLSKLPTMETNLAYVMKDELNYCNQNVIPTPKTFSNTKRIRAENSQREEEEKRISRNEIALLSVQKTISFSLSVWVWVCLFIDESTDLTSLFRADE